MITTARATRSERWSPSCSFEFELIQSRDEATKSGARGRGRRPFASASASLSEGVMSKPSAGYSPPPHKPKVCLDAVNTDIVCKCPVCLFVELELSPMPLQCLVHWQGLKCVSQVRQVLCMLSHMRLVL